MLEVSQEEDDPIGRSPSKAKTDVAESLERTMHLLPFSYSSLLGPIERDRRSNLNN